LSHRVRMCSTRCGHGLDTTPTNDLRLRAEQQPPGPLVQMSPDQRQPAPPSDPAPHQAASYHNPTQINQTNLGNYCASPRAEGQNAEPGPSWANRPAYSPGRTTFFQTFHQVKNVATPGDWSGGRVQVPPRTLIALPWFGHLPASPIAVASPIPVVAWTLSIQGS